MTDKDIIKALEIHADNEADCSGCPIYHSDTGETCAYELAQNALDLINRQKAEIERVERHTEMYHELRAEAITEFAERLKGVYINDKRYDCPNPHTLLIKLFANIDQIAKEMKGE